MRFQNCLEPSLADPTPAATIAKIGSPTVGTMKDPGFVETESNCPRAHNQCGARGALEGSELGCGGVRKHCCGDAEALGQHGGELA